MSDETTATPAPASLQWRPKPMLRPPAGVSRPGDSRSDGKRSGSSANIIDLGLVYGIVVDAHGEDRMTLTSTLSFRAELMTNAQNEVKSLRASRRWSESSVVALLDAEKMEPRVRAYLGFKATA